MLNENKICKRTAITMTTVAASAVSAFAAGTNFIEVVQPIIDLLDAMLAPLLLIVGAVGSLYCVLLGVKYARAEEPQDREKAKAHLKNAIIGFLLIFMLIVLLNRLTPVMTKWAGNYQTTLNSK